MAKRIQGSSSARLERDNFEKGIYRVKTASTSQEALDLIHRMPPDFIFLDLVVQGKDAMDVFSLDQEPV